MAESRKEGIALLAAVTGESEEAMRRDGRALVAAFASLTKISLELIRGYASEDPAVREAAHRRWSELDAMLPKPDAQPRMSHGLSDEARGRLHATLTTLVESLREPVEPSTAPRQHRVSRAVADDDAAAGLDGFE